MKIVLTGASGLVGQALGLRLVKEGHSLVVLLRNPKVPLPFPAQVITWQGVKEPAPALAFADVQAVVHLAGESIVAKRWTPARKHDLVESRVRTAQNLKVGLTLAGVTPSVLITASAIGIYGDRNDEILRENSAPGHDFLAELCLEWEAAAQAIPADRCVCARFGVILSHEGGYLAQVTPIFKRLGGSRIGSGRQWFSWIHMDDLVEALILLLNQERAHGAFNLVAPQPITNQELTSELTKQLKTFSSLPMPAFAMRILYGELAEALLGSQRVVPGRLEEYAMKWRYPSLKSALTNILSASR